MFFDEASIASRIDHPNVCTVFDFGEIDGTRYIAMEYIVGETLGHVLRRLGREGRHIPVAYASRIVADVAEGLHAAHELHGKDGELLGVIHRDVSPQNVFLAFDGTVRIVDFGIARAADRMHQTKTGVLKGKLSYMPPEQLRRTELDRRADVWALGVVFWELLTGRRLFKRDSEVDTMLAVERERIPKPSELRRGGPAEVDRIVMRALERERDDRYPTARALARDVRGKNQDDCEIERRIERDGLQCGHGLPLWSRSPARSMIKASRIATLRQTGCARAFGVAIAWPAWPTV